MRKPTSTQIEMDWNVWRETTTKKWQCTICRYEPVFDTAHGAKRHHRGLRHLDRLKRYYEPPQPPLTPPANPLSISPSGLSAFDLESYNLLRALEKRDNFPDL
ncbi:hypothetical protein CYLTODRAFT_425849 [Cylindrobasidium torrendii FP15055 ss-10]|uniref:Uncharacterized protein n=1 Tax=Cylindrobasidium torrendii FP15055 ss-10 TaxID=1314674 RepID=A0A0D7B2I0_9AGAR|nr:hypothetical protein CYLTODRAFT_425849 [Cylindrobasidium torrendii FP15055 ss-10]